MGTAFALILATVAPAQDLEGLLGNGTRPYVAPGREFALSIPDGWQVVDGGKKREIQLVPSGPGDPVMFIRRVEVPVGADPMHLALRALEERLKKMPRFEMSARRRVKLGGHEAASITGSYAFQGNIQFPRAIEEVYVVVGGEAFMFHFDCFVGTAGHYVGALTQLYQSFVPRPADSPGVFDEKADPSVEVMPF